MFDFEELGGGMIGEELKNIKFELEEYRKYLEEQKKKTSELEEALMRLLYVHQATEISLQRLHKEFIEFKNEMRAFRDEMLAFKDEMRVFKDEMRAFKDEMRVFKDEMRAFKDEMRTWREEVDKDRKHMNKQWGELANKLGTIVEDIIFPATRPVLQKYFNCDPDFLGMNIKRKRKDLKDEFDIIAACKENVFLIEVKATPRVEYIKDFQEKKVPNFKKLFPEFIDKRLILIFASLRIEEDIVRYLTRQGIYAMAYREWEYMDILNFDEVQQKRN